MATTATDRAVRVARRRLYGLLSLLSGVTIPWWIWEMTKAYYAMNRRGDAGVSLGVTLNATLLFLLSMIAAIILTSIGAISLIRTAGHAKSA